MKDKVILTVIFTTICMWVLFCYVARFNYETKQCYAISKKEVQQKLRGRYISPNSYGTFYQITYVEDKTGLVFTKNVPIDEYTATEISTSKLLNVCPNENTISLFATRVVMLVVSVFCGAVMLIICFIIEESIS